MRKEKTLFASKRLPASPLIPSSHFDGASKNLPPPPFVAGGPSLKIIVYEFLVSSFFAFDRRHHKRAAGGGFTGEASNGWGGGEGEVEGRLMPS